MRSRIIGETLRSTSVFFSALYSVLIYEWACRVRLYFKIYDAARNSTPILGFLPSATSKLALGAGFFRDSEYAFALAVGIWMACALVDRVPLISRLAWKRLLQNVLLITGLFSVSLIFCVQYSLITLLHAGLTRSLLTYAIQGSKPGWYLSFVTPDDVFFLLLIFGVYYFHLRLPSHLRVGVRLMMLLGIAASFVFFWLDKREMHQHDTALLNGVPSLATSGTPTRGPIPWIAAPEISGNSLGWLLKNVILAASGTFDDQSTQLPMLDQRRTVGFVDPAFVISSRIEKPASKDGGETWNVVFLLLESIGSKYATDSPGEQSIMPFTNQLASQGLVLENHFSGGIDTDYATFPILTAMYPIPAPINFVNRNDLRFPTIFSLVGHKYSNTFVSETDATVFFPNHLMLNTGLMELWDANTLPTRSYRLFVIPFKDPSETAAFFAKRVDSLPEPFVAVYNLYATHAPYFDYDRKGDVAVPTTTRDRYKKNVALVDRQIKLVMDELAASGRADRTIVVITSDHGEAFGEHSDDFGHGLYLFNEAVHVPMLFYQPKLIKPTRVSDVTSHVDILPTLLDVMGVQYDPLQFQGESIIRKLRRKYVFIYGPKPDAVASVSRDLIKLVVMLSSKRCQAYDLKVDPNELRPVNCGSYQQQINDLLEFRNHQLHFLPNYAASCQEAWPCAAITPY